MNAASPIFDAILEERLFDIANAEGNHGEDAKKVGWTLDAAPIHCDQRMVHPYPQGLVRYADPLADGARRKGADAPEYGIEDTGIFAERRSSHGEIACATQAPDDIATPP